MDFDEDLEMLDHPGQYEPMSKLRTIGRSGSFIDDDQMTNNPYLDGSDNRNYENL
jgi:hypothetical protein